jgi:hypothetical protein
VHAQSAGIVAAAQTLRGNELANAIRIAAMNDPSTTPEVEMESFLRRPVVYNLITSAGLAWCERSAEETAENVVAQCYQHHGARAISFRDGDGTTRITGWVWHRGPCDVLPMLLMHSLLVVGCALRGRDVSWPGMKTIAFITTDSDPDGYFIDVMPDLLVTASSADWQTKDPMALPVAQMEYKAAGVSASDTTDM